ncbi:hypothetical protein HII36_32885 [Nonomuraea sp. NN258]|uniref:Clp protease N-terminal domain-containing protein n=1 Tax=Nonomuraea antri TaxID=2730852 RepID=UPI001569C136|nr:Clp protease N-terminal domain-containing protein [Nonomuraea antri]NRQ36595.1 hypothetical protein [Nonomuraea antri]
MLGMEKSPFAVVIKAASEEAGLRGDRRIGTEHLLLGLLRDPGSETARALGVGLAAARAALDELDHAALRALGIDVADRPRPAPRRPRPVSATALSTSARAAVNTAIKTTTRKTRPTAAPGRLLLALLDQGASDPVTPLIDQLGLDRTAVRDRIA